MAGLTETPEHRDVGEEPDSPHMGDPNPLLVFDHVGSGNLYAEGLRGNRSRVVQPVS